MGVLDRAADVVESKLSKNNLGRAIQSEFPQLRHGGAMQVAGGGSGDDQIVIEIEPLEGSDKYSIRLTQSGVRRGETRVTLPASDVAAADVIAEVVDNNCKL